MKLKPNFNIKNSSSTLGKGVLVFSLILFLNYNSLTAQNLGINSTGSSPNSSAALDIDFINKGLLIPRIALTGTTDVATIPTPATSLLVYNTVTVSDVVPGYYYYNGSVWERLSTGSSWLLTGNAGTNANVHFIGTTDNIDLVFKRNNIIAGRIGTTNLSIGTNAFGNPIFNAYGNTAIGSWTLYANYTGYENTAIGFDALGDNYSGYRNTANGSGALNRNFNGYNNTANGYSSLYNNVNGCYNTSTGANSMYENLAGAYNTANGYSALQANIGHFNTAIGSSALFANTTGFDNIGVGANSLFTNTVGNSNTAIGTNALYYCTGNNNIAIGSQADVPTSAGWNQVRIGNASIVYAGVQVAWTITSDKHLKSDIKKTELGLDFIKKLNPVSYYRNNDETEKTEYGFIAQELEATLINAGATNNGIISKDDAGMYSVRYNDLLSPMVKAIQEQQVIIEKLMKRIEELEEK